MKTNNKSTYDAPATTVVEVKTEGVVCSSTDRDPYGNPIKYEWD